MGNPLTIAVDNTKPAVPDVTVRRGTLDDMLSVFKFLVRWHYPMNGIGTLSEHKAAENVEIVFRHGYVFIAERDGHLAGTIGLLMGEPFWYSTDRALFDRWTCVHPKHRASHAFRMLRDQMQRFSDDCGIPLLTAVMTPDDPDRKNLLYRRSGFVPIGELFVRGFDRCVSQTSAAVAAVAEKPQP